MQTIPKRLPSYKHIVKTYPSEIVETDYSTTFDISDRIEVYNDLLQDFKV